MKHVLVIEDDEDIRRGVKLLLEFNGHAAVLAGTVAEGLEKLSAETSHVLLDINLPDGFGTTIARRIRLDRMPIKIAVVSACMDADVIAEMQALAPDATFERPTDWDSVLKWLG